MRECEAIFDAEIEQLVQRQKAGLLVALRRENKNLHEPLSRLRCRS
jgi:hypothetical protein